MNSMQRINEQIRQLVRRRQAELLRRGRVPRKNQEVMNAWELLQDPPEKQSPILVEQVPGTKLFGLVPFWMKKP